MFGHSKVKIEELSQEQEAQVNAKFNSFKKKSYSEQDMNNVFDNEDKIMGKMDDKNLAGFVNDVKVFFCMLKDFFTKKYTQVPVGTIVAIASSLLYVLSPIDLIPDLIPVIGYLDDAAILAACLKFVKKDVDEYKLFKGIE